MKSRSLAVLVASFDPQWFFPVAGWWRTLPGLRGGCNQFRIRRQRVRAARDRTLYIQHRSPGQYLLLAFFDRSGYDMVFDAESDLFFPAPVGFIDRLCMLSVMVSA